MILGFHKRTIDAKGRMILPREIRKEFAEGLVVTKGLDNCLYLFPIRQWEKLVERIEEMSAGNEETRRFTRLFFSNASHQVPDSQGRVRVPTHLRQMAGLSKEAVIVGLSNKAEVWNPDSWDDYQKSSLEQFEQSASDIGF